MTDDTTTTADRGVGVPERMPWGSLVLLTATGFVLVTMETMPAGPLSAIAAGFDQHGRSRFRPVGGSGTFSVGS